jgi:hypothetical protein
LFSGFKNIDFKFLTFSIDLQSWINLQKEDLVVRYTSTELLKKV